MANIASAKKRVRQAVVRNKRQSAQRSMLRTYMSKVAEAISAADKTSATKAYAIAAPVIDSMASKGIIHKHKAARYKSGFCKKINSL